MYIWANIYLDKAIFKNAKIEINVNVKFGELKIFVPKNSRVNNSIDCLLSESKICGVSDNVQCQDIFARGSSLFAEIQIIYI